MNSVVAQTLSSLLLWFPIGLASFLCLMRDMLAPHIQGVYIICVTVSKVLMFVFCWSPEVFHVLFPTSISIIIHSFSCIRKPVLKPAHKAQLPELLQLDINKISRRNYSAAEKKKKKDAFDEISHQAGKVMSVFYSGMEFYSWLLLAFVEWNSPITQKRTWPPGPFSSLL